jgi:prolyl-tRNA synthetase
MKQSQLVTKTSKETSKEDPSRNAQLLVRAGFVNRLMAGVYSFLPLGNRVLQKIEQIVREEMNSLGAQEILMPALHPKEIWDQTGRWDKVDVLFRFKGQGDRDLCLGPTHEEVVTPLIGNFIRSYRDLPASVYQIQTKFRNEVRAKSGLLRGREFRMKDLYSFHTSLEDLDQYYEQAIEAYKRVFARCGLGKLTVVTFASGGIFSKYSHEFQTITEYGEDIVYKVPGKDLAINRELIEDQEVLAELVPTDPATGKRAELEEHRSIEVGNIFKLGTRFSDAFDLTYLDSTGTRQPIYMGCYGIGPSRVMGTIAEVLGDERGLIWPKEVAPYSVHLVSLCQTPEETAQADEIYATLSEAGIETLYDDRTDMQAGAKFADSDLIGIPWRVVISKKTLAQGKVELKSRSESNAEMVELGTVLRTLSS